VPERARKLNHVFFSFNTPEKRKEAAAIAQKSYSSSPIMIISRRKISERTPALFRI
jgi:hypothetical protein